MEDVLKPPGSLLATDRSKRVGVSCRNLYSFVVYLNVNCSGSITSV